MRKQLRKTSRQFLSWQLRPPRMPRRQPNQHRQQNVPVPPQKTAQTAAENAGERATSAMEATRKTELRVAENRKAVEQAKEAVAADRRAVGRKHRFAVWTGCSECD